ncbi:fimbrial protein [Leclercia adecarboxylata]|uniref:fimbrial protein n=1 Tax=Leclercia adecarboxylata TaxID=83655 RepID=UPI00384FEFBE
MRKIITLIGLMCFYHQASATCEYKGSEQSVGFNLSGMKILSDATIPTGTVLAAKKIGGNVANMKTFYNCGPSDVYAVLPMTPTAEAVGVKGIQGGKVYETGIPGIGFQISDAIKGTNFRPSPVEFGTVNAWKLNSTSSAVQQLTVWLIKTNEDIDTSVTTAKTLAVSYRAGSVSQVESNSTTARLLRANLTFGPFTFRQTSCDIKAVGGSTITLDKIKVSKLVATLSGTATGNQKSFTMQVDCPKTSVGNSFIYWFNPLTENSSSKNGVLLNSIPTTAGGAGGTGFILKQDMSPIKFYDYTSYSILSAKATQQLTFNADYIRTGETVTVGQVRAMFEIVLQER